MAPFYAISQPRKKNNHNSSTMLVHGIHFASPGLKTVAESAPTADSERAMNALLCVAALVTGDLNSRRKPGVQVVEKVCPAVVYVGTVQLVERSFRSFCPLDDFFFGPRERTEAIEGLGSGVI